MSSVAAVEPEVEVHRIERGAPPRIDVCVPVHRYDATVLVRSIAGCEGAEAVGLRVYDDGSNDPELATRLAEALKEHPGPSTLAIARVNRGRSCARNALIGLAESPWLLFLDADMKAVDRDFLRRYRETIAGSGPALVVGGFQVEERPIDPTRALHHAQSVASECLPASARRENPGAYVYTSNLLVHRDVLSAEPFDEGFVGWGCEDVEWGIRVGRRFPLIHIDNPALHLGLDTDEALIRKYRQSGPNFRRVLDLHPAEMSKLRLTRAARALRVLPSPLRRIVDRAAERVALDRERWPLRARLVALKLLRAGVYAEHLDARPSR